MVGTQSKAVASIYKIGMEQHKIQKVDTEYFLQSIFPNLVLNQKHKDQVYIS